MHTVTLVIFINTVLQQSPYIFIVYTDSIKSNFIKFFKNELSHNMNA